jgi:5-methylcytosine-specific restriction endonuclease McrA
LVDQRGLKTTFLTSRKTQENSRNADFKIVLDLQVNKGETMKLSHLSNRELLEQTKLKAECERRMLFAEMGYRDLKEYCVKELKYSEGSAWRRISAMRTLRDIPEVQNQIQSGELNLTQITLAHSHFRAVKSSKEEKQAILDELANQTSKSTERILAEKKPEDCIQKPAVTERALRGQKLEITLLLDSDLQENLDEIQILLGKRLSKLELLKWMIQQTLQQLRKKQTLQQLFKKTDPEQQLHRKAQPLRSRSATQTRYIPAHTKRIVLARDQHRCQYKDPKSHRQCESRLNLQFEHKKPFAKFGETSPENLQLLCANHNRLRAVQQFGHQKMQRFVPSLRSTK